MTNFCSEIVCLQVMSYRFSEQVGRGRCAFEYSLLLILLMSIFCCVLYFVVFLDITVSIKVELTFSGLKLLVCRCVF